MNISSFEIWKIIFDAQNMHNFDAVSFADTNEMFLSISVFSFSYFAIFGFHFKWEIVHLVCADIAICSFSLRLREVQKDFSLVFVPFGS